MVKLLRIQVQPRIYKPSGIKASMEKKLIKLEALLNQKGKFTHSQPEFLINEIIKYNFRNYAGIHD